VRPIGASDRCERRTGWRERPPRTAHAGRRGGEGGPGRGGTSPTHRTPNGRCVPAARRSGSGPDGCTSAARPTRAGPRTRTRADSLAAGDRAPPCVIRRGWSVPTWNGRSSGAWVHGGVRSRRRPVRRVGRLQLPRRAGGCESGDRVRSLRRVRRAPARDGHRTRLRQPSGRTATAPRADPVAKAGRLRSCALDGRPTP